MRVRLTDRFVKSATTNGRNAPIFMDDEVIGFGVQVRGNGRKSFTLDYRFEVGRRRLFIGDFPEWSTVAAREEANVSSATSIRALTLSPSGTSVASRQP
jgi:Arm DNA-binding domain